MEGGMNEKDDRLLNGFLLDPERGIGSVGKLFPLLRENFRDFSEKFFHF
jgi:hypothetical protein